MDNATRKATRFIISELASRTEELRQLSWESTGMDQDTLDILQRAQDELETAVHSLNWALDAEQAAIASSPFAQSMVITSADLSDPLAGMRREKMDWWNDRDA